MLKEFFQEWNLALNSRVPRNETKGQDGTILIQISNFMFRGVEIEMISKLGTDNKYYGELFVPSTNKFVPNRVFKTKTECAIEILMAIAKDNKHMMKRLARAEKTRQSVTEQLKAQRRKKLGNMSFSPEYLEYLHAQMDEQLRRGRSYWDDAFIAYISKFHQRITLVGSEFEKNNNLRLQVINAIYGDIAITLGAVHLDRYGHQVLPANFVDKYINKSIVGFRKTRAYARTLLQDMNNEAASGAKFIYYLKYVAAYFEQLTGMSIEAKQAEEAAWKTRMYQRRLTGADPKNGVNIFDGTNISGTSLGSLCPELDTLGKQLNTETKVEEQLPDTTEEVVEETKVEEAPKKKVTKKKKVVTDNEEAPKKKPVKRRVTKKIDPKNPEDDE